MYTLGVEETYDASSGVADESTIASTVSALVVTVGEVAVAATLRGTSSVSSPSEKAREFGKLTQMRPACQLSGTLKDTEVYAAASHLTEEHAGQAPKIGWSWECLTRSRSREPRCRRSGR